MNDFKYLCELCDLVKGNVITKKYHEDEKWIIVDCKTCKVPMAVFKKHTMVPKIQYVWQLYELFKKHIDVKHKCYKLDFNQRAILDHCHVHYRKVKNA